MRQCIGLLETIPLFEGIPAERIGRLLDGAASVRAFSRSETLFGSGDFVPSLAFLLSGSALVYKGAGENSRVLMSRLSPGDVFGMASLFHEQGFPTEIVAEKAGEALFWPKVGVEAAISLEPRFAQNYIALLSERIHFLNRRIDALCGDDLRTRVLRLFAQLSGEETLPDALMLSFSLSQVAELLGVGRASLYRTLDALEAEGVLRRDGKHVTILKTDALHGAGNERTGA